MSGGAVVDENESQNTALFLYLAKGSTITGLEALNDFGIMRLAARIYELKKRGYDILDRWIITSRGKKVKEYWLKM